MVSWVGEKAYWDKDVIKPLEIIADQLKHCSGILVDNTTTDRAKKMAENLTETAEDLEMIKRIVNKKNRESRLTGGTGFLLFFLSLGALAGLPEGWTFLFSKICIGIVGLITGVVTLISNQ